MSEKMAVKEKLSIIKRSIKLVEDCDRGHLRRAFVNVLPDVISTFSGVFLASLVIDGVTGGKPVTYLLTAAAIVCGIELISQLIRCINNSRNQAHDAVFFRNAGNVIWRKVLNMDYAKVEDISTRNKLDNAKTYLYNSNRGIYALTSQLAVIVKGILELVLGIALAAPILFSHSEKITDFPSFILSGWGVATVLALCAAQGLLQSLVIIPKAEKMWDKMYTDPEGLQASRECDFYQRHIIYNYRNGKSIVFITNRDLSRKSI